MTTQLVRLGSTTGLTESGNGTTGWNYIGNLSGSFGTNQNGLGDIPLTGDGYFYAIVGTFAGGNDGFMVGLDATNSAQPYTTLDFGVYWDVTNNYLKVESGTPAAANNTVAFASGDWLRISRVGSTLTADRSQNSGAYTRLFLTRMFDG